MKKKISLKSNLWIRNRYVLILPWLNLTEKKKIFLQTSPQPHFGYFLSWITHFLQRSQSYKWQHVKWASTNKYNHIKGVRFLFLQGINTVLNVITLRISSEVFNVGYRHYSNVSTNGSTCICRRCTALFPVADPVYIWWDHKGCPGHCLLLQIKASTVSSGSTGRARCHVLRTSRKKMAAKCGALRFVLLGILLPRRSWIRYFTPAIFSPVMLHKKRSLWINLAQVTQVQTQDLCKGCLVELWRRQKFGPQNWGSGVGGRARIAPVTIDSYSSFSLLNVHSWRCLHWGDPHAIN